MIFVRHTERRKSPGVFQVRIEREAIVFDRKRSAVAKNLDGPRKIMAQNTLETFAPSRRAGREATQGETNRRHVETGVETAAAVEAYFIGIEFVEIVEDAADGKTFVVVQWMLEDAYRECAAVEH